MISPRFRLTQANVPSILKSTGIVVFALVGIAILDYVYPGFDMQSYRDAVLALSGAWLVNLAKEWVEQK